MINTVLACPISLIQFCHFMLQLTCLLRLIRKALHCVMLRCKLKVMDLEYGII